MSTKPIRIQLPRRRGWLMPPNAVRVVRATRWGNPYDVREYGLELSLRLFEETARGGWSPAHVAELDEPTAEMLYAAHCAWLRRLGQHPIEAAQEAARLLVRPAKRQRAGSLPRSDPAAHRERMNAPDRLAGRSERRTSDAATPELRERGRSVNSTRMFVARRARFARDGVTPAISW
jgi:hypothetical protein